MTQLNMSKFKGIGPNKAEDPDKLCDDLDLYSDLGALRRLYTKRLGTKKVDKKNQPELFLDEFLVAECHINFEKLLNEVEDFTSSKDTIIRSFYQKGSDKTVH